MKAWLIWTGGVIAAIALVVGNIDKIVTVGVKWLGPYLAPYVSPRAVLSVRLDTGLTVAAQVFVADPADDKRVIAVSPARADAPASLEVPANTRYTIGWQGTGLEPNTVANVLAVKGSTAFRLIRAGEEQGQVKLNLRQSDAAEPALPAAPPSAALLISARSAQLASDPSSQFTIGSSLPEIDRAAAIIGLFETGTTDCSRRLFFPRGAPAVGCFGAGIPGFLGDTIGSLDNGEAHHLDALIGADYGSVVRSYAQTRQSADPAQLRQAIERLAAAPEFWISYQQRVLAAYAQAAAVARTVGLVSERGRLLIFDAMVMFGPGRVAAVAKQYAERYPDGAPDRPATERDRIGAMGALIKAAAPSFLAHAVERRVDTIATGRGTLRGVSFDLEQLGVSDAG